jgi:hypothetical protein
MTTKTRLLALALAVATSSTALVAGVSAKPAEPARLAPIAVHNTAVARTNTTIAGTKFALTRTAAPVAGNNVAKLPPGGTRTVARARPNEDGVGDDGCLHVGDQKALCVPSVTESVGVLGTLATIISLLP